MTWRTAIVINLSATIFLTCYLALRLQDSPQYLYSKGSFTELRACLKNIARRNGMASASTTHENMQSYSEIESIMEKLRETKRREEEEQ